MHQPATIASHAQLEAVISFGRIMERIDRSAAPFSADQYQVVVSRLKTALSRDLPEAALDAILELLPAAADVFENMHYEHSGLSRSSLERSAASEVLTAKVLAKAKLSSKAA